MITHAIYSGFQKGRHKNSIFLFPRKKLYLVSTVVMYYSCSEKEHNFPKATFSKKRLLHHFMHPSFILPYR